MTVKAKTGTGDGATVTMIPPRGTWSPRQVLDYARQMELGEVIVVGWGERGLAVHASATTRAQALWLLEQARLEVLGV